MPTPRIRHFQAGDLADVYDVCVRTADAGGDARGMYRDDDLMPDIFAGPYVALEPELAFVLDDGSRVVGYVIGTADTDRFVRRYRAEWIPRLADRYPPPGGPPATREEEMIALHHNPEHMLQPELADHPAHLHIDLLPQVQGRGHGRGLMETMYGALAAAGAPALHVSATAANRPAVRFYRRLGFYEIGADADTVHLGRSTTV